MLKSTHTGEYALLRKELSAARDAAGLTQRALARKLGVPHTWVSKVESGERRIDLIECGWFLVACEVDPMAVLRRVIQRRNDRRAKRLVKWGR